MIFRKLSLNLMTLPFRGALFKHTAFFHNESKLQSPSKQLVIKNGP